MNAKAKTSNQSWEKYQAPKTGFDFCFLLNVTRNEVVFQPLLAEYLGYADKEIDYAKFTQLIPKEEYSKLHRIHRMLLIFYERFKELRHQSRFILIHRLVQADGKLLYFLREIYFLPQIEGQAVWCRNNCVDISNVPFSKGIQFDVYLLQASDRNRRAILRLFKPVLDTEVSCFSSRQLEVLKTWEETDSIALAANRLNISTRTMETHLRNMRRKVGVRRTMDVLLLAKERGWV